ncbi:MAG: GIY-YIG nuclease family protein [Sphingobacteriales bacterium]|nr:GIY-YIG nuclease family protein [Sphingobacteriales bacterium]
MYFVYILYSSSLDKYYVGSTEDVTRRLVEHNMGKGNFSSKGIPWILIITFDFATRSEAVQLELKIKKRGIKRYLQDINAAKSSGSGAAR